jgi:hypothetical protein
MTSGLPPIFAIASAAADVTADRSRSNPSFAGQPSVIVRPRRRRTAIAANMSSGPSGP